MGSALELSAREEAQRSELSLSGSTGVQKNLCLHDLLVSVKMKETLLYRDEVFHPESAVWPSTFRVSGEAAFAEAAALHASL